MEKRRDCCGPKVKGLLPRSVMEGFQEQVAFTRLGTGKREEDISAGRSGLNESTEEERAGKEMTSSSAGLEKVLLEQETQSPDYMNVQHRLYILLSTSDIGPRGFKILIENLDSASCLAPMGNVC